MLKQIYYRLHNVLHPSFEIGVNDLIEYIDEFNKSTVDLLDNKDDSLMRYNYYFDQLESFTIMYPNYDYHMNLQKKHQDIIGYFFMITQPKPIKVIKRYEPPWMRSNHNNWRND